jgi:outer membrane PBP1 activator LpoA protein
LITARQGKNKMIVNEQERAIIETAIRALAVVAYLLQSKNDEKNEDKIWDMQLFVRSLIDNKK